MQRLVSSLLFAFAFAVTAPAFAAISASIVGPAPSSVQARSVTVRAKVQSSYSVTGVKAKIGAVEKALTLSGAEYIGDVDISLVPEGPTSVVVEAANAIGEVATATSSIVRDEPPSVSSTSPIRWTYTKLPGVVRIRAACSDTAAYPCEKITVGGLAGTNPTQTFLASSIDQDFEVRGSIGIRVTDSLGLEATTTIPLVYNSSADLSVLLSVPGRVLDIDDTRVLYTNAAGLFVRDRLSLVDSRLGDGVPDPTLPTPAIRPGPVLALVGAVMDPSYVSANGRYVVAIGKNAWGHSWPIARDLLTGQEATCVSGTSAPSVVRIWGVTDVGDVVWRAAQGAASQQNVVCRFSSPSSPPLPAQGSGLSNGSPLSAEAGMVAGNTFVYQAAYSLYPLTCATSSCLAPIGANVVSGAPVVFAGTTLAPQVAWTGQYYDWDSNRTTRRAGWDFRTTCGHVAYTQLTGADITTYVRSPSGTTTRRGVWPGRDRIDGLAPNGEVVIHSGGNRYIVREGQPPVFLASVTRAGVSLENGGGLEDTVKWSGGRWLVLAGNAVLSSVMSPPVPLTPCEVVPSLPDAGAPPFLDAGALGDAGKPSLPEAGAPADAGAEPFLEAGASGGVGEVEEPDTAKTAEGVGPPSGCSTAGGVSWPAGTGALLIGVAILFLQRRGRRNP
jgi:hypothetical protein